MIRIPAKSTARISDGGGGVRAGARCRLRFDVDAGDFLAEAAPRVEALGWKLCKTAEGMLDPMAELDWEEFRQTARALEER